MAAVNALRAHQFRTGEKRSTAGGPTLSSADRIDRGELGNSSGRWTFTQCHYGRSRNVTHGRAACLRSAPRCWLGLLPRR